MRLRPAAAAALPALRTTLVTRRGFARAGARRDLLATTGDYLRIWRRQGEVGRRALAPPPHPEAHPGCRNVVDNKSVRLDGLLNNNKNTASRPRPEPRLRPPRSLTERVCPTR